MAAQHSPGPRDLVCTAQTMHPSIYADGTEIARVAGVDHGIGHANALLIAAAPGLLHTLEALVALRDTPEDARSLDHACTEGRLWGTARALLTQVNGR